MSLCEGAIYFRPSGCEGSFEKTTTKYRNCAHIHIVCLMRFQKLEGNTCTELSLNPKKRFLPSELYFSLERLSRQRLEVGWRAASSKR